MLPTELYDIDSCGRDARAVRLLQVHAAAGQGRAGLGRQGQLPKETWPTLPREPVMTAAGEPWTRLRAGAAARPARGPGGSRRYKWQASVGRAHGRALAPPARHQKIAYKLHPAGVNSASVAAAEPRALFYFKFVWWFVWVVWENKPIKKKKDRWKSLKMLAEAGEADQLLFKKHKFSDFFCRSSFF